MNRMFPIAVALFACFVAHESYSRPLPIAANATAEVRMDHISIIEMGKGSPVILIPGLSSPRAVWDGVAADLAKTHRVVLVQVNGFGGDDPGANLKPGLLDGIVANLDSYIVKHKLQTAAVVGHSMGGLVGLMLAKAHPAHLGKLMIVDSLPWYGMLFGPTATVAMAEPQARAMRDKMVAGYGKPDPEGAKALAARFALHPDAQPRIAAWIGQADARVSGAAMYEDLTTDLRADLPKITTPLTVVFPTSPGLPKTIAEPFYKGAYKDAPHVSFVEIDDSAHFIMLDQPELFAKALGDFVAR